MASGMPAVALLVAFAWRLAVTALVEVTPEVDRPVRITEPTCRLVIADAVVELTPVAGVPTMNSWPTRWASLIRAKTSCAGVRLVAGTAACAGDPGARDQSTVTVAAATPALTRLSMWPPGPSLHSHGPRGCPPL